MDCYFCNKDNCCESGCQENWNSDNYLVYPKCPKAEPICNQETMLCQETPGSILLNKIVISTKECTGCDPGNDGVNLKLTGSEHMWTPAVCYVDQQTGLHHPNVSDFYTNSTTIFATTDKKWYTYSRDYSFGWNNCWKVGNFNTALINLYNLDSHFQRALEGQVSRAEVSWMGDGVWEPESICFDWTNDDFKVREDNSII